MTSLLELLKQKKQQMAAANRRKTAKIPDGTSRWRILPSWRKGDNQFWHDFGAHYIHKPGEDKPTVYVCVDKTFGKPCEVCAAIGAAIKTATDDATLKLLQDARASGRVLVNALHLDGTNPTEVQILELPGTVFGQIVEITTEWAEAGESPIDVGAGKGKDFMITRTGTGLNTKYLTQVAAKTTPVSADVLTRLHDLDAYVATENEEAQQRALQSVRAAAGLMTAPTTAGGIAPSRLAPPAAATTIVEDEYAVAAPPKKRPPAEDVTDVIPDSVTMAGVSAPAAAPAAAVSDATGDPELDALLKSLG